MNKKILFRCDSSSLIGHGHTRRCLVFANQCDENDISFATQSLEGNINHLIPYAHHFLKSNDIQELSALINREKIDLLILDHYAIHYEDEKKLKTLTGVKILSFDDTYERHYCDILLNHNIGAKEEKYSALSPDFTKHLCGEKYTLIKKSFHPKKVSLKSKKHLDIYLSFGGTDPFNLLQNFIRDFKNVQHTFHITTTSANVSLSQLKQLSFIHRNFKLYIDQDSIAEVMQKCDFAIITPSVSVAEVLKMQIPFLAIKVIDNQKEIYNYLKSKQFQTLARYDRGKIHLLLSKINTTLPIYTKRKLILRSGKQLCNQTLLS